MARNRRRWTPSAAPICLSLVAVLCGESSLRADPPSSAPPAALYETPFQGLAPPAWEIELDQPKPVFENCGSGFTAQAEYLMWRPRLRLLDYADSSANGQPPTLKYLDNPGFRTGLDYEFPGGWDVGAGLAYLESSAHGLASSTGQVTPSRPAAAAYGSAKFYYGALDLEAGRTLPIEENLRLRLTGGIRFAELGQNRRTSFFDGAPGENVSTGTERYRGAGPTAAAEMNGALSNHWSLYGKLGGGVLFGESHSALGGYGVPGYVPANYSREGSGRVVPVLNLGLGVACEYRGFSARIGYDFTDYFGAFERAQPAGNRYSLRAGDVSLDGFGIRFGFGF